MIGPIEKDVPLPKPTRRSELMQRLADLEVGDSFITDHGHAKLHSYASRLGITITTRYHAAGQCRVWRVETPKAK
jgi:hypothetical protein